MKGYRRGDDGQAGDASKVYCEDCDAVFDSRERYETHLGQHGAGGHCESCPLDVAFEKLRRLFRKG